MVSVFHFNVLVTVAIPAAFVTILLF